MSIYATRFNNGNIHIKGTPDPDTRESTLIQVLWALNDIDCDIIGDEYCRSNYDVGITVYSYYSDMCYDISYTDLYKAIESNHVYIIKGRTPDEWDRELIDATTDDNTVNINDGMEAVV